MSRSIESVLVVGSGTMGRGIATSFVRGGHAVWILSRDPVRAGKPPEGTAFVGELPPEQPDLVIEAVAEEMDVKTALFRRLEAAYGSRPILATNTSGLPMQEMADRLADPSRFIGIHYFQPAEALPLVEVIRTEATAEDVFEATVAALARNGQGALAVRKPVAGFIANRLQHAILHEAFSLIEEGVATVEDIDRFAKFLFGPRLCVTGLVEQKDLSGLHITARTQRNLVPTLNRSGSARRVILEKLETGDFGVSTGRGFYDWRHRDVAAHKRRAADKLKRILAIVQEE